MNFLWRYKKRIATPQEIEERRNEAQRRAEQSIRTINQKIADLEKAEEAMRNHRGGPGGPDDSAGAVRVC